MGMPVCTIINVLRTLHFCMHPVSSCRYRNVWNVFEGTLFVLTGSKL